MAAVLDPATGRAGDLLANAVEEEMEGSGPFTSAIAETTARELAQAAKRHGEQRFEQGMMEGLQEREKALPQQQKQQQKHKQ